MEPCFRLWKTVLYFWSRQFILFLILQAFSCWQTVYIHELITETMFVRGNSFRIELRYICYTVIWQIILQVVIFSKSCKLGYPLVLSVTKVTQVTSSKVYTFCAAWQKIHFILLIFGMNHYSSFCRLSSNLLQHLLKIGHHKYIY